MTPSKASLYRKIAAEGATYIGLLTAVLDSLAEDLRIAGVAVTCNDIPARCAASNHALLLLGHLESWAVEMEEPSLKASLLTFYAYTRSSLISMQIETNDQPFRDLAMHVTQLRSTWQKKEMEFRKTSDPYRTYDTSTELSTERAPKSPSTWSA